MAYSNYTPETIKYSKKKGKKNVMLNVQDYPKRKAWFRIWMPLLME